MSIHVGFLGPSLFGKSHAAKTLSRQYWTANRRRSLVFDVRGSHWGDHALVVRDRDRFVELYWKLTDLAVFVDDMGDEMEKDRSVTSLFTSGRHNRHVLHAISHAWTDWTTKQRNQFGTLFVFWQTADAACRLAREWSDDRLLESTKLPKYEFLYCRKFGENPRHKITRGRFPA